MMVLIVRVFIIFKKEDHKLSEKMCVSLIHSYGHVRLLSFGSPLKQDVHTCYICPTMNFSCTSLYNLYCKTVTKNKCWDTILLLFVDFLMTLNE